MISQTSMLLQQSAADEKKRQLLEKMKAKKLQQQQLQQKQQIIQQQNQQQVQQQQNYQTQQIQQQEQKQQIQYEQTQNKQEKKQDNYDKRFLQSLQDLQVDKNEDKQITQQINKKQEQQAKYNVIQKQQQAKKTDSEQINETLKKYVYTFQDNDFIPSKNSKQYLQKSQNKSQHVEEQVSTSQIQQVQYQTGDVVIGKNVQNLFKMLPSDQKRCLDLLKQQNTEVQIEYDKNGNALVTLLALKNQQGGFQNKALIKQQFMIKQEEIPQGQLLKERKSKQVNDYIQKKQIFETKQQEQMNTVSLQLQENNQLKSLLWINKQIYDLLKQRIQFLQYESKGIKKDNNYYSMFTQQVQTINLDDNTSMQESKTLPEELAGSDLVTSMINQKSEKCQLITLEEFITQQIINSQMQIKAETYIEQFQQAILYYSKYSAPCRFMLLFMPEVCPNYDVYSQVTNQIMDAQPVVQQFIYRKSDKITAEEFIQIRSRSEELFIATLLVLQEMLKHCQLQRVNLPVNEETIAVGLPKIVSVYVSTYLDFKPFAGNVLVRLFSKYNSQLFSNGAKLTLLNSGFIMNELQGFGIWVKNSKGDYEAELYCILICLVRVLNAIFQEINDGQEE